MNFFNPIKQLNKNIRKYLQKNYPLLGLFYSYPRRYLTKFKPEKKLRSGKDISKSTNKSIVLFTTHKSASTFMSHIINEFANSSDMVHINFETYIAELYNASDRFFKSPKFMRRAFISRGYIYGSFRQYIQIPELDKYRVIVLLRDPRDVLTSLFFSHRYSHPVINLKFFKKRRESLQYDIDQYALENAQEFKEVYSDYITRLLPMTNVKLFRYEDMIANFDSWLRELVSHCELPYNEALIKKIVAETNFEVNGEDIFSHKRNVKAGDHLNKLKSTTIEELTNIFDEELKVLGYKSRDTRN
ncbi:MAG: sulfotransferase domain-containing protein [Bacteroidales bacterium]|nr:sulfotransferase domain-containing protein [Bacteroidales bacterium]